jgi:hypothetical protein
VARRPVAAEGMDPDRPWQPAAPEGVEYAYVHPRVYPCPSSPGMCTHSLSIETFAPP